MKLNVQKRLSASILKSSKKRIKFDQDSLEDIKEAITKDDIRGLIKNRMIIKENKKGVSRARANEKKAKKARGQKKGHGKRKGKKTARMPKKELWMAKIRKQREFLRELKDKGLVSTKTYRMLYLKAKGGFFRSKRHLKLYINDNRLFESKADSKQ